MAQQSQVEQNRGNAQEATLPKVQDTPTPMLPRLNERQAPQAKPGNIAARNAQLKATYDNISPKVWDANSATKQTTLDTFDRGMRMMAQLGREPENGEAARRMFAVALRDGSDSIRQQGAELLAVHGAKLSDAVKPAVVWKLQQMQNSESNPAVKQAAAKALKAIVPTVKASLQGKQEGPATTQEERSFQELKAPMWPADTAGKLNVLSTFDRGLTMLAQLGREGDNAPAARRTFAIALGDSSPEVRRAGVALITKYAPKLEATLKPAVSWKLAQMQKTETDPQLKQAIKKALKAVAAK